MDNSKIYDFLAVGVGPFNLGLACLSHNIHGAEGIFLDKSEGFDWHPGMMIEDTTLQVPFMADLVTLTDPTNPFSFLNYLKEQGRIYSFYIKEDFLVLRKEYNQYCQWAISKLPNIRFNSLVKELRYNAEGNYYVASVLDKNTDQLVVYRATKLVLGTGTVPYIPQACKSLQDEAIHSSAYLSHKERMQKTGSITVVGSGQSAAEIFYDLLQDIDMGYKLSWITRSPRFFPLEYTKLTLEMTSPEYVDYFYNMGQDDRDRMNASQKNLYKGINQDLINSIFDLMYSKKLDGPLDVHLRTNSELLKANHTAEEGLSLEIHQVEQDKYYRHNTESLILATGYRNIIPGFTGEISDRIQWDNKGRYQVNRNYSIDKNGGEIFVQNAELHTHGFVTPDLGMGCYRNARIINSITGRDCYPVEKRIAFQQFSVSPEEEIITSESFQI